MSAQRVTIVGGGLAGLTLGIGLRQCGVPVTVWEAGHYPRHRVCGEFISGRGLETLSRLGLQELLVAVGAIPARTVAFCSARISGRARDLPLAALCLPRWRMDATLAERFRALDGELREDERWTEEPGCEGVVLASGRRLRPVVNGWRWFGLKAHATGVVTSADLDMHLGAGGYVGLGRQPGGIVNVCGLFRRKVGSSEYPGDWQEQLRGAPGSLLRERMGDAAFVPGSFCSVAGINPVPECAEQQTDCRIGDALTMIPPMTGNGMSIAFESAEIAIRPLVAWSRREGTWADARQLMARACHAAFARRLAWAKWLQKAVFADILQAWLVAFSSHSDWFWRMMFAKTR